MQVIPPTLNLGMQLNSHKQDDDLGVKVLRYSLDIPSHLSIPLEGSSLGNTLMSS